MTRSRRGLTLGLELITQPHPSRGCCWLMIEEDLLGFVSFNLVGLEGSFTIDFVHNDKTKCLPQISFRELSQIKCREVALRLALQQAADRRLRQLETTCDVLRHGP